MYNDTPGADATERLYEWQRRLETLKQLKEGTKPKERGPVPSRSRSELPVGSSGMFVEGVCVRLLTDWVHTTVFAGEVRVKKQMTARDGAVLKIQVLR